MSNYHTPVLTERLVEWLDPRSGQCLVDGTLGGGGHARALAPGLAPGGFYVGIDRDPEALEEARRALCPIHGVDFRFCHGEFSQLRDYLVAEGIGQVQGILLDLGVSSHQLDTASRGFSFRRQGPLDMRMDPTVGESAASLLNRLPEGEIAHLLFAWGEEPRARRIAAEIVRARPLQTTEDLSDAVRRGMPFRTRPGEIHPATRTFQAVRIAVNRELEVLEVGLRAMIDLLAPGGRIAVLTYHSLEDRIVKRIFQECAGKSPRSDLPVPDPEPVVRVLTPKPQLPSEEEIRANPRARSAKLRVAEKR